MHSEHHRHGCGEYRGQSPGPELYYGYCHETGRMRMMNYPDYVQNVHTGLSNMVQGTAMQPIVQPMLDVMGSAVNPGISSAAQTGSGSAYGATGYSGRHGHGHRHRHHEDCGCGCHHHDDRDCGCYCCVRCADLVEYARCGEIRRIPVTFDNDTRRERNVKLTLGAFATQGGQETGWATQLSDTQFTLGPCGEKTVVVSVSVDCSKIGTNPPTGTTTQPPPGTTNQPPAGTTNQPGNGTTERQPTATVDSCKVAYASLSAEGCAIRPLILAVAVLPEHCYAHQASCGCGCCD